MTQPVSPALVQPQDPATPQPQPGALPAQTAVPTAPVAPAAPAAPAAVPSQPVDPAWLNNRLAQAKRSGEADLLKKLGVATEDEARAAVQAAQGATAATARSTELETVVKQRAEAELATLTEDQKKAVTALAGSDPAKILSTIDTLKSTWTPPTPQTQQQQQQQQPQQAGRPAPATTTAAAPPPAPASPPTPVNHLEVYENLQKNNPMMAAHYLELHGHEVQQAREAKRNPSA